MGAGFSGLLATRLRLRAGLIVVLACCRLLAWQLDRGTRPGVWGQEFLLQEVSARRRALFSAVAWRALLDFPCAAAWRGVFPAEGDQAGAGEERDDGHDTGHREDHRERCAAATESGQARPCEPDGDGIDPDDADADGERQDNQLPFGEL